MGGMLTQPETNKSTNQGEGLGLRYGLSSMQGWRSEMEDAHDVHLGLNYGLDDWSFFAVFDGHAGKRAAAFAALNLLEFILRDSQFELQSDNQEPNIIEPKLNSVRDKSLDTNEPENEQDHPNGDQASSDHKTSIDKTPDQNQSESMQEKSENDKNIHPSISETQDTQDPQASKKQDETEKSYEIGSDEGQTGDDSTSKPKFGSFPILKQLVMVENAIKSGFLKIDETMRASSHDVSGCTAVCTFISPTHLFIANCGDSRAVLYNGNKPLFVTEDHKPFNPKERKRIIDAGGSATQRINGTLAVSRALGDFEFKKNCWRGPCEQLVSPEPEVTIIERDPSDKFLILACDGIWDVMDNYDLCHFIQYKLTVEPSLEKVCSSVLDVCLHKGSRDNMSIIIVVFENGPKYSEEARERDKKNDEVLSEMADREFTSDPNCIMDFNDFIYCLKSNLKPASILPPGAGIEGKYDLLHEIFEKNFKSTMTNEE